MTLANNTDTIFALSSGPLPAGVAIVRVSGSAVPVVLTRLAGDVPRHRRTVLRHLRDETGEVIDQAIVIYFRSGASFTGEDIAEFQVHGGRAVVAAVLSAIGKVPGCRLATPGEFSLRAFVNGQLDLTALEGLSELIAAETEVQRRQALAQSSGLLRQRYDGWRMQLLDLRAAIEADLDFSDQDDVPGSVLDRLPRAVSVLRDEIAGHLASARYGEIVRDGFKVALVGPPNAGKSSLINALAKRDVAIVSAIAGTTRDAISVQLDLDGYKVIVTDTAGLRETEDEIERIGAERALQAAAEADLVLALSDQDRFADIVGGRLWHVRTKSDLGGSESAADRGFDHVISTLDGSGLSDLFSAIVDVIRNEHGADEMAVVGSVRQEAELSAAVAALGKVVPALSVGVELAAEELRLASDALARVTGTIDSEQVLGAIFSRFCIGK